MDMIGEAAGMNLNEESSRAPSGFEPYIDSSADIRIPINSAADIVEARKQGLSIALEAGCSVTPCLLVSTIIAELSRNILLYGGCGEVILTRHVAAGQRGMTIVAVDRGRGIEDIAQAMSRGYSSSGGMGLGLSGVRDMADEFELFSRPGEGTRVTVRMLFT